MKLSLKVIEVITVLTYCRSNFSFIRKIFFSLYGIIY